jgi:stage II sporulation protein D
MTTVAGLEEPLQDAAFWPNLSGSSRTAPMKHGMQTRNSVLAVVLVTLSGLLLPPLALASGRLPAVRTNRLAARPAAQVAGRSERVSSHAITAATPPTTARSAFARAAARATVRQLGQGTFEIRGGGFGHGIGMSQYGAMGFAEHGWNYQGILAHYYQGTSLGHVPDSTVTVLLNDGAATVRGADEANGHPLSPTKNFGVIAVNGKLELISDGRRSAPFAPPLRLTGTSAGLTLLGHGSYAGSLVFYPSPSGGVLTVNAVDLEDYVRGVIAEEMPSSWPEQALEAQAVAARSYVLADAPVNPDYDVYSDTRSQMYGGISAETPATDTAEAATRGQVVESAGRVVPAYFFASSGGYTESIQNVWLGVSPAPYLVGVPDPYDTAADDPYYRWQQALSLSTAAADLSGLYRGAFKGITILAHGVSPRIVSARVLGTLGSSVVPGATLESDLSTDSTWMSFTTVTARGAFSSGSGQGQRTSVRRPTSSRHGATSTHHGKTKSTGTRHRSSSPSGGASSTSRPAPSAPTSGGAGIGALARSDRALTGTVSPASPGASITVERASASGWSLVTRATVTRSGSYAVRVFGPGLYRVVYHGVAAPAVRIGG